jgi:hypothetical protein
MKDTPQGVVATDAQSTLVHVGRMAMRGSGVLIVNGSAVRLSCFLPHDQVVKTHILTTANACGPVSCTRGLPAHATTVTRGHRIRACDQCSDRFVIVVSTAHRNLELLVACPLLHGTEISCTCRWLLLLLLLLRCLFFVSCTARVAATCAACFGAKSTRRALLTAACRSCVLSECTRMPMFGLARLAKLTAALPTLAHIIITPITLTVGDAAVARVGCGC